MQVVGEDDFKGGSVSIEEVLVSTLVVKQTPGVFVTQQRVRMTFKNGQLDVKVLTTHIHAETRVEGSGLEKGQMRREVLLKRQLRRQVVCF